MSALEEEIIDRFRQLSPEDRVRMLSALQAEVAAQQMSLAAWLAEADAVRLILRPDVSGHIPTASELVNEIREERDADILRSLGLRDSIDDSTD